MTARRKIVSGIQPSGVLHLGNYFGAIQQHLDLAANPENECVFFIADYHALTTVREPEALRAYSLQIAAAYLALGLDTSRTSLVRQSDFPEVHELTWFLGCVTHMGTLERAHSYKDKKNKNLPILVGVFGYPLLMAADILIHEADMVPVGKDQHQHVQIAEEVARHFNEAFGKGTTILKPPAAKISPIPTVPGLDGRKMSKSYGNQIPLFEPTKTLKTLISKGIVTQSIPLGEPLIPGVELDLLKLFMTSPEEHSMLEDAFAQGRLDGKPFGYGHAKALLSKKIEERFGEARGRFYELLQHQDRIEQVLAQGRERIRPHVQAVIRRCREAVGL